MVASLRRKPAGFSLLELLLVLGIVFIAFGLILAGVHKLRESAARTESAKNLKLMALALHNAGSNYDGQLPPSLGPHPQNSKRIGTLFYHLTPYLEQDGIYGLGGDRAFREIFREFVAPGDPTQDRILPLTSYASNRLVFGSKGINLKSALVRGGSNLVVLMERFARNGDPAIHHYWAGGPVGEPGNPKGSSLIDTSLEAVENHADATETKGYGFQIKPRYSAVDNAAPQSMTSPGLQVAMADGSAKVLGPEISAEVWFELCKHPDPAQSGEDW
jgi:hypothetical protein